MASPNMIVFDSLSESHHPNGVPLSDWYRRAKESALGHLAHRPQLTHHSQDGAADPAHAKSRLAVNVLEAAAAGAAFGTLRANGKNAFPAEAVAVLGAFAAHKLLPEDSPYQQDSKMVAGVGVAFLAARLAEYAVPHAKMLMGGSHASTPATAGSTVHGDIGAEDPIIRAARAL